MALRHSALSGTVRERQPLPLPHGEVAFAAGGGHVADLEGGELHPADPGVEEGEDDRSVATRQGGSGAA